MTDHDEGPVRSAGPAVTEEEPQQVGSVRSSESESPSPSPSPSPSACGSDPTRQVRSRKQEKFKRHLAALGKGGTGGAMPSPSSSVTAPAWHQQVLQQPQRQQQRQQQRQTAALDEDATGSHPSDGTSLEREEPAPPPAAAKPGPGAGAPRGNGDDDGDDDDQGDTTGAAANANVATANASPDGAGSPLLTKPRAPLRLALASSPSEDSEASSIRFPRRARPNVRGGGLASGPSDDASADGDNNHSNNNKCNDLSPASGGSGPRFVSDPPGLSLTANHSDDSEAPSPVRAVATAAPATTATPSATGASDAAKGDASFCLPRRRARSLSRTPSFARTPSLAKSRSLSRTPSSARTRPEEAAATRSLARTRPEDAEAAMTTTSALGGGEVRGGPSFARTTYSLGHRLSDYPVRSLPTNPSEDSDAPPFTEAAPASAAAGPSATAAPRVIAKRSQWGLYASRSVDGSAGSPIAQPANSRGTGGGSGGSSGGSSSAQQSSHLASKATRNHATSMQKHPLVLPLSPTSSMPENEDADGGGGGGDVTPRAARGKTFRTSPSSAGPAHTEGYRPGKGTKLGLVQISGGAPGGERGGDGDQEAVDDLTFRYENGPLAARTEAVPPTDGPLPSPDGSEQSHAKLVPENLARHDLEHNLYDDPPLEEIQSEVSAGFDMRSILDHPPLDDRRILPSRQNVTEPSWEPSAVLFEDTDEKKDDPIPGFHIDDMAWQQQPTSSDVDVEEKKERDLEEMSESYYPQTLDTSWDTTRAPQFAQSVIPSAQPRVSDLDMFDTSSWAATEAKFSEVSLSGMPVNTEAESRFVQLMMEEMETRELTQDERRMVVEAQRNLSQAEESKQMESRAVQKDDVPLMGLVSVSDDGATVETTVPLEDRLRMYVTSNDPDTDSVPDDEEGIEDDDEDNFEDGAEAPVEYVGHEEDLDDDEYSKGAGRESTAQHSFKDGLKVQVVSADEVPTFEESSFAAMTSSSPYLAIPVTLEELKNVIPPPPPSTPKKKKKGRRNKFKSDSSKGIPLLAPPPEEKLKKWQHNLSQSEGYVEAMKQKLAAKEAKASSTSVELFQFIQEDDIDVSLGHTGSIEAMDENVCMSSVSEGKQPTSAVPPSYESAHELEDASEFFPTKEMERLAAESEHPTPQDHFTHEAVENKIAVDQRLDEHVENEVPDIDMFVSGISDDESDNDDHLTAEKDQNFEREESQKIVSYSSSTIARLDALAVRQGSLFNPSQGMDSSIVSNEKIDRHKSSRSVFVDQAVSAKDTMASSAAATTFETRFFQAEKIETSPSVTLSVQSQPTGLRGVGLLVWYSKTVLKKELILTDADTKNSNIALSLFSDEDDFNKMCQFLADSVNNVTIEMKASLLSNSTLSSFDDATVASEDDTADASTAKVDSFLELKRPWLKPVILSSSTLKLSSSILAANYVSFIYMAAKLTKIDSPFGDHNPFLTMIVESSLGKKGKVDEPKTPQGLIVSHLGGRSEILIDFVYKVHCACELALGKSVAEIASLHEKDKETMPFKQQDKKNLKENLPLTVSKRFNVPGVNPSPFETCVWEVPRIVAVVLSFLGDPVAVCRMKMVNRFCCRVVAENEHMLMQIAVRSGGIDMSVRPAFWMWITLQKCDGTRDGKSFNGNEELNELERCGKEGKWHHVIQRDVARSFGNMPPHKTGARLRTDSIVRALVTWGQNRIMKRGVKGGGEPLPVPDIGPKSSRKQKSKAQSVSSPPWESDGGSPDDVSVKSEVSETPTDTVSDWGAVSPKGSFAGSITELESEGLIDKQLSTSGLDVSMEELALSGNCLAPDVKLDLQRKLSFILHCLAATHEDIGYCQGMDYVVAHLLRILQETIRWQAAHLSLPSVISSAKGMQIPQFIQPDNLEGTFHEIDSNLVVEETVLRVMDTLFMNYNLRHMYWPELRCLKTCCRVFERLIQIKLPVLADHFEHHDLNVGLFALGWFQTLFLYLPSMPSATVCHMWDIWLVERSFKIFFRVGTAILFLSQPILLNHELEGMMTYLNTIPDATLLRPDILIPCALNIKVTNRMLQHLEAEVMMHP